MGEGLPLEAYEPEEESSVKDELQDISSELSSIKDTLDKFGFPLFIMMCSAIMLIVWLFRHW